MLTDQLVELAQKVKDGTASPAEKELVYKELSGSLAEVNKFLESLMVEPKK